MLQENYNVQFIISLGNNQSNNDKIVSPADSLSGISVGANYLSDSNLIRSCTYSVEEKILWLYSKPNVCDYSNDFSTQDNNKYRIKTINQFAQPYEEQGTSLTAPLITRKFA
jgi:hypothetical protein